MMQNETPNQSTDDELITNEDGHTINDLMPSFPIPTLLGYLDEAALLALLDLHDERTIAALENTYAQLELTLQILHHLDDSQYAAHAIALAAIFDNARDLNAG